MSVPEVRVCSHLATRLALPPGSRIDSLTSSLTRSRTRSHTRSHTHSRTDSHTRSRTDLCSRSLSPARPHIVSYHRTAAVSRPYPAQHVDDEETGDRCELGARVKDSRWRASARRARARRGVSARRVLRPRYALLRSAESKRLHRLRQRS